MECPCRDGVAQQQDRRRRQTGRNRRQKSVECLPNILGTVHPELNQQRLAERSENDFENLQYPILGHEKLQIHTGTHATAANAKAPVSRFVEMASPTSCGSIRILRHPDYGWGHSRVSNAICNNNTVEQ